MLRRDVTILHLLFDAAVVVAVCLAVGVFELRRHLRSDPSGDRRESLARYGRRVVRTVAVLAAFYFFGYAVGFHHGAETRCDGVWVSPQAVHSYPHLYRASGCYALPEP
jgi:hypothetical protein